MMNRTTQHALILICATLVLLIGGTAHAATATHSAKTKAAYDIQYDKAKKEATSRYSADKKLCNEENESGVRMQCKRDANDEYQKALSDAKEHRDEAKKDVAAPAKTSHTVTPVKAVEVAICKECGKVTTINVGEKQGKGGPVGMIAGGVAGALIGHQVGKGTGKDLATIAGAAGGAYAGRKVEEKMTTTKYWAVSVLFENGEERTYEFDHEPGLAVGDAVKTSDNSIVRR
mgnify:CR=1 FL=1